jgi:hypothetical protein
MTVTQISMRNSRLHRHAAADAGAAAHTRDDPWTPSCRRTPFCRLARVTVGVACALLTAALLTGRTATPTQPDGAASLTQLQSNPELASPAPLATKKRISR